MQKLEIICAYTLTSLGNHVSRHKYMHPSTKKAYEHERSCARVRSEHVLYQGQCSFIVAAWQVAPRLWLVALDPFDKRVL